MTLQDPQRRYPSPLRYPGGKGKIANYIKLLLLENDLIGSDYVEIYAGGAAVALSLLFEEYVGHIYINDVDKAVYAFWRTVLDNTEYFCHRIENTEVTISEWERQKAVQDDPSASLVDLAFSTFFLNRTNRSGIIKGGVIGGKKQTGKWQLDARYNKKGLIKRIRKIGRYRDRITLTRLDAAVYIRKVLPRLSDKTMIYLDPPYFLKGGALYRNSYSKKDHAKIARLVSEIRQGWLVSYDAVGEIFNFYEDYESLVYGLSYSAQKRYRGSEVMFLSPELDYPDVPSPANIQNSKVENARRMVNEVYPSVALKNQSISC